MGAGGGGPCQKQSVGNGAKTASANRKHALAHIYGNKTGRRKWPRVVPSGLLQLNHEKEDVAIFGLRSVSALKYHRLEFLLRFNSWPKWNRMKP